MRRAAGRWALRLLGPLLLILLLSQVDLAQVWARVGELSAGGFALALAIWAPILWLRTLRWLTFFRGSYPLRQAVGVYGISLLAGAVTPGQVGEVGRLAHVVSRGESKQRALVSLAWDRGWDVAILGLVAAAFLATQEGLRELHPAWPAAATVVAASAAALLLRRRRKALGESGPASAEQSVGLGRRLPSPRRWGIAALATTAAWLLNWTAVWVLARGLDLPVSWPYLAGTMAWSAMASALPITLLGVGTRDAVLVVSLARLDIVRADALALSAAVLLARLGFLGVCVLTALATGQHSGSTSEPVEGDGSSSARASGPSRAKP